MDTTIFLKTSSGSAPLSISFAPLITGIAHVLPVANAATFTAVLTSSLFSMASPTGRNASAVVSATGRIMSPATSATGLTTSPTTSATGLTTSPTKSATSLNTLPITQLS